MICIDSTDNVQRWHACMHACMHESEAIGLTQMQSDCIAMRARVELVVGRSKASHTELNRKKKKAICTETDYGGVSVAKA